MGTFDSNHYHQGLGKIPLPLFSFLTSPYVYLAISFKNFLQMFLLQIINASHQDAFFALQFLKVLIDGYTVCEEDMFLHQNNQQVSYHYSLCQTDCV